MDPNSRFQISEGRFLSNMTLKPKIVDSFSRKISFRHRLFGTGSLALALGSGSLSLFSSLALALMALASALKLRLYGSGSQPQILSPGTGIIALA